MDPILRRIAGGKRKRRIPTALGKFVGEFTNEPLQLARESACLLTLSALDLFMTHTLLRLGMNFYESNPIAQWWFARWNMVGITIFKFLVVSIAIVASEIVERRRPGLGRGVLVLGNVAAALVVAYSINLLFAHTLPASDLVPISE